MTMLTFVVINCSNNTKIFFFESCLLAQTQFILCNIPRQNKNGRFCSHDTCTSRSVSGPEGECSSICRAQRDNVPSKLTASRFFIETFSTQLIQLSGALCEVL